MEIIFEGEHLLAGQIGHLSVYTAFTFSLIAAIAFFISSFSKVEIKSKSWLQIAQAAFIVQSIAVISIAATLFVIIQNHWFEYFYAWSHSSKALPPKYLLACFWEGQEGSFLLWMFWNSVLGIVLIITMKGKQAGVLGVFSVVQLFLASMLLGLYFFEYKIGSNPFTLLRNEMQNAPIFKRADYLSFIQDGNGLNPLLQNYWMVIHPPILFLGFASTLIPFSFALSGLLNRDFTSWAKPVLPWSLFSCAIFGTGIMMGGAWAYESLTFGGYWAWDPVEECITCSMADTNRRGTHKSGLQQNRKIASNHLHFLFALFSACIVCNVFNPQRNSGNTSVHAFTDLGMSGQLLVYMAALALPAIILLAIFWKKIPTVKKDEDVFSREFWIFIGSLVFLISALQITFTTSIPVWNKLFGTNWAPPVAPIEHYNKFQIPVAIIILLLSATALYLKFKKSEMKQFINRIAIISVLAVVATVTISFIAELDSVVNIALLFGGCFGIIANFYYIIIVLKGKMRLSGAAVAHFGFALMMVGILISSAKKQTISFNSAGINFGSNFSDDQQKANVLLYKDIPVRMNKYTVTYAGDSAAPPNYYYKVIYEVFDSASGKLQEKFTLYPNAQINPKMGLIANPDTRHYLSKDVYTHVTSVPDKTKDKEEEKEELKFTDHTIAMHDTIFTSNSFVVFEAMEQISKSDKVDIKGDDLAVEAQLLVKKLDGKSFSAKPIYYIHELRGYYFDDVIEEMGLTFRLTRILPDEKKIVLSVAEEKPKDDWIVLTAIVFPFINLLWLGTVITIAGFFISMVRLWQKKKSTIRLEV